MILQQQIKTGLHFQLKAIPLLRDNNSFLSKSANSIVLTCIFSGLNCNIHLDNNNHSHEIQFTFQNEFLKRFASDEQEFSINQFPEPQQHDICCTTQMILHDIITCKLQGAFRNMFLESKALALLLCFQKCNTIQQHDCTSCKFLTKPVEKEKIYKAKEILLNRLNNTPTIPELAMQIGINQCYLKKGFKEIFGTTVYDFVQEQRMLKAQLLLSTTNFSVSQIADTIGFSSISNFSSAFKKHTGVFPSELQRN